MKIVLRRFAVALALAGLIDPPLELNRNGPLPVRLHLDARDSEAVAVRASLQAAMADRDIELVEDHSAAAVIAIGNFDFQDVMLGTAPISWVTLHRARDVSIVDAPQSITMLSGRIAEIRVGLEGRGVAGSTSVVVLEDDGLEVSRIEHKWANAARASVVIPYLATTSGVRAVKVRVLPAGDEERVADNEATFRVLASDRPLKVAAIEPRPSWPAAFVRRALEADPMFHVASLLRVSRGISVSAGSPPPTLTASTLTPFDVILLGAPEELRGPDVEALRDFIERRGGTVVFLPDKLPSGPYRAMLPGAPSEQLLREPVSLPPAGILASETLSIPRTPEVSPLAIRDDGSIVIASWPRGDGRVVYSGALDAWRFRADARSAFVRFWRETLSAAALASPARVQMSLSPAVVRPGGRTRLAVRFRRTEMNRSSSFVQLPAVSADVVAPNGHRQMIRLWPGIEAGSFEGEFVASAHGPHNVRVFTDTGAAADTTLLVQNGAAAPVRDASVFGSIPELTGGITVDGATVEPVLRRLAAMPRPHRTAVVHPMRSVWWMLPFVSALCLEWVLRRRSGLR